MEANRNNTLLRFASYYIFYMYTDECSVIHCFLFNDYT